MSDITYSVYTYHKNCKDRSSIEPLTAIQPATKIDNIIEGKRRIERMLFLNLENLSYLTCLFIVLQSKYLLKHCVMNRTQFESH